MRQRPSKPADPARITGPINDHKDGTATFDAAGRFASNGYGVHSPGGYSLLSALVTQVVMTMMFLLIILGATDARAPKGFAPLAIGLGLTLIHLISIPVTATCSWLRRSGAGIAPAVRAPQVIAGLPARRH